MKHNGLFRRSAPEANEAGRLTDFAYLDPSVVYLDSACQSLRPQPVLDSLTEYYTTYNACGGRVKYAWGRRVDEEVAAARQGVLGLLGLSSRHYAVSFTLNTTFGLNLLLQQLPQECFASVITSHAEHNSVFLPTMTAAKRLGVPRLVLDRADDGALLYEPAQLERAVVVVNAVSNVDGRVLTNLTELVRDTHARGGIVILDAAQAMAHERALLQKTAADAICFSGHKMYSASLGVIIARRELLASLELTFVGGGMVTDVREDSYDLLPDDPGALLEPGLQAWGEIIALRHATDWLGTVRPGGRPPAEHLSALSERLFDALSDIPGLTMVNATASPVISVYAPKQDSHRLAVFLSQSGISVRSGYFCAHHHLKERLALPPLLRFSLGLHSTTADIDRAHDALARLMKGLS